jgi:hypothetical protein
MARRKEDMSGAAAAARGEKKPLNLTFGTAEVQMPAEPDIQLNSGEEQTTSTQIPEGESYLEAAAVRPRDTRAKIYSGGKMVLDRTKTGRSNNKDIEAKIKEITSNPELDHSKYRDEWADVAAKIKQGERPNPVSAQEGYDHIKTVHGILKSYLDSLPEEMMKKAGLHDEAAESIDAISPNHPKAAEQRQLAATLRNTLGFSSNADERNNLRSSKEDVSNGAGDLGKNLQFNLKVNNKLVKALTSFNLIKRGSTGPSRQSDLGFPVDSPDINHSAVKQAHTDLRSVVKGLHSWLGPLKMKSPISTTMLDIWKGAIDNLQKSKDSVDIKSYRETHPFTGVLSKPGHIWGEKPNLDFNNYPPGHAIWKQIAKGKDPRELEQIPLTDEGLAGIKERFGDKHPLVGRFTAAKNSLKKSSILDTQLASPNSFTLPTFSPDDGRNDARSDDLVMGEYSESAARRREANPPARFPDSSPAGTIGRQVRTRAQQSAEELRENKRQVAHHSAIAFESLISNKEVPQETADFLNNHPEAETIRKNVINTARAHIVAVNAIRANQKIPQDSGTILGKAGRDRARKAAAGE